MNCRKARILIPFAADETLDEPQLRHLREHMSICSACADHFNVEYASIQSLKNDLKSVVQHITVPDNFAAIVASHVVEQVSEKQSMLDLLRQRIMIVYNALIISRKAATAAACAVFIAATLVIGITAGRILDSSPVASTRVYSGHLVVFTVQPRPDGNIVAGTDALNYCKVARSAKETVR